MKLKYETGIATLIQFVTLSVLNVANGAESIVTTCRQRDGDCISNTLVSMTFFILVAGLFGCIWVLGYLAQERRSKRLAQLLILVEALIAFFAYVNIRYHNNALNVFTSVVDLILAIWIITLAFRLMRSKGGRVVSRQRARQRKHSTR